MSYFQEEVLAHFLDFSGFFRTFLSTLKKNRACLGLRKRKKQFWHVRKKIYGRKFEKKKKYIEKTGHGNKTFWGHRFQKFSYCPKGKRVKNPEKFKVRVHRFTLENESLIKPFKLIKHLQKTTKK